MFYNLNEIDLRTRVVHFVQRNFLPKKMFNQDEEKMECAVGNREMGFWQYKKAEIVLLSFLTS